MSRQKILLLIVAFLAVLQFLVVPGFAYIDEQNETVSAKNNKSQKEQALLQLKEPIAEQLVQVEGSLAELRKFTFKTDSIEAGSLEVQKIFETTHQTHQYILSIHLKNTGFYTRFS